MKKQVTHFIALAALLLPLLGASSIASAQDFTPAPVDGARLSLTTAKASGESIKLLLQSDTDNLWIDLNDNGIYEEGEKLPHDSWDFQVFNLQKQSITIYGDLKLLYCQQNQLTTLDLSKLTQLAKLLCFNNQIEVLDVRHLTKLEALDCQINQIASLDVSNLESLRQLNCFQNQLRSLNLVGANNLRMAVFHSNQIKVAEMKKVVDALPNATGYPTIRPYNTDAGANEKNQCTPEHVKIATDKGWGVLTPTGSNFSGVEAQEELFVVTIAKEGEGEVSVTGAEDLNAVPEGTELTVAATPTTGWVLTALTANGSDILSEKKFTVTAATEVKAVFVKQASDYAPIDGQSITFVTDRKVGESIRLKLDAPKANIWVDLNGDKVYQPGEEVPTELEEATFTIETQTLTVYGDYSYFSCDGNQVTSIDVSNVPHLRQFYCGNNLLTSIDLSKAQKLERVGCNTNKLTSIDLSGLSELTRFYCYENQLTKLDLSGTPKIQTLGCQNNQLTSLDLAPLENLTIFSCSSNQITAINVGDKSRMLIFTCYDNLINEEEMQKIVEALPTRVQGSEGSFIPFDPSKTGGDKNICTMAQVSIAKSKYWNTKTPEGKDFLGTDGLEEITSSYLPIKLVVKDGILHIMDLKEGMQIEVYTIDGHQIHESVASTTEESVSLSTGVYVLRIGNYSAKVIIP